MSDEEFTEMIARGYIGRERRKYDRRQTEYNWMKPVEMVVMMLVGALIVTLIVL